MVPKRELIIGLQLILQRKELQIAAGTAGMEELLEAMMQMRVKITPAGNETFGGGGRESMTTWCWRRRRGCGR